MWKTIWKKRGNPEGTLDIYEETKNGKFHISKFYATKRIIESIEINRDLLMILAYNILYEMRELNIDKNKKIGIEDYELIFQYDLGTILEDCTYLSFERLVRDIERWWSDNKDFILQACLEKTKGLNKNG